MPIGFPPGTSFFAPFEAWAYSAAAGFMAVSNSNIPAVGLIALDDNSGNMVAFTAGGPGRITGFNPVTGIGNFSIPTPVSVANTGNLQCNVIALPNGNVVCNRNNLNPFPPAVITVTPAGVATEIQMAGGQVNGSGVLYNLPFSGVVWFMHADALGSPVTSESADGVAWFQAFRPRPGGVLPQSIVQADTLQIFAAASNNMYRSDTMGATWVNLGPFPGATTFNRLTMLPGNRILATDGNTATAHAAYTDDFGASWTVCATPLDTFPAPAGVRIQGATYIEAAGIVVGFVNNRCVPIISLDRGASWKMGVNFGSAAVNAFDSNAVIGSQYSSIQVLANKRAFYQPVISGSGAGTLANVS